jgi:hypothetical protein
MQVWKTADLTYIHVQDNSLQLHCLDFHQAKNSFMNHKDKQRYSGLSTELATINVGKCMLAASVDFVPMQRGLGHLQ